MAAGGRRRLPVRGAVVVIALAAGAACGGRAPVTRDPRSPAVVASGGPCGAPPRLLGTPPHAARQPTPRGRTLHATKGWMGRLYFGYGDIEANTGPIEISSYDPA